MLKQKLFHDIYFVIQYLLLNEFYMNILNKIKKTQVIE